MTPSDDRSAAWEQFASAFLRLGEVFQPPAPGHSDERPSAEERRTAVSLLERVRQAVDQAPVRALPVAAITIDPAAAVREGDLRHDVVERLRLSAPESWAPVIVRPVPAGGGQALLVDGRHRLEAARQLGLQTIRARVIDLDDGMTLLVAGVLNAVHGQPLTKRERALLGARLYRAGVLPTLRQGAALLGVSFQYIHKALRGELDRDPGEREEPAPAERFLRACAACLRAYTDERGHVNLGAAAADLAAACEGDDRLVALLRLVARLVTEASEAFEQAGDR